MPDTDPTSGNSPVTLITGASSGIGLELAKTLADAGHRLALVARSPDRLDGAKQTLIERGVAEDSIATIQTDMSDSSQADALVGRAVDAFGRVDCLVNNAGAAPLEPISKHDVPLIRGCFATNTTGPAIAIASLWRHFIKRGAPDAGERRVIVNVSSIASVDPFPGFFAYAASKAAVEMLARSCANEGKELGVHAFAVAPGAVETPLLRGIFNENTLPASQTLAPADVASLIADCVLGRRDQDNGETVCIVREGGEIKSWVKRLAAH